MAGVSCKQPLRCGALTSGSGISHGHAHPHEKHAGSRVPVTQLALSHSRSLHNCLSSQSVSPQRIGVNLTQRWGIAGMGLGSQLKHESASVTLLGSSPGAGGVLSSKGTYRSRNSWQTWGRQAAGSADSSLGSDGQEANAVAQDAERTAALAHWLDNKYRKNLLGRAIDAAFLLQGINAAKDVIASKLASLAPNQTVVDFISKADQELETMKNVLKTVMDDRKMGRPVSEELLERFVKSAKSLAVSLKRLQTGGSKLETDSEDVRPMLVAFLRHSTAGNLGRSVAEQLAEHRDSHDAREKCTDYVDALVEQFLEVVQSLIASLESVKALFPAPKPFMVGEGRGEEDTGAFGVFTSRSETLSGEPGDNGWDASGLGSEPVDLPYKVQRVFFATDRVRKVGVAEGELAYTNKQQAALERGWTDVSIPKKWEDDSDRQRGEMGDDPEDGSDRAATYHITLLTGKNHVYPSTDAFRQDLLEQTDGQRNGLLLFIHGYNTSFRAAIRGAAQLAFDLRVDEAGDYNGAVLAFDWASNAELFRYGFSKDSDRERAENSAAKLADLLQELAADFPEKKLHIVAHSMGNYCLMWALRLLAARPEKLLLSQIRSSTSTVTFAAPDVAREDFKAMLDQLLPLENGVPVFEAPLATLFCSRGDLALLASSILRFFGKDFEYRAGLFRAWQWLVVRGGAHRVHPVLLPGQVDTVDASGFAADSLGHGYFSNNRSLLNEISLIINSGKDAKKRLESSEHDTLAVHNADCKNCNNWYRVIAGVVS